LGFGVSFILVCLFAFFFYNHLSKANTGFLAALLVMLIFGLIDDFKELSIGAKFIAQILSVSILILFGIRTYIVSIGVLANIMITFVWVIGITNAINHLDVMDGLAGVIAAVISFAFFIIAILNSDINTAIIASVLLGAILSFLIFNFPPAKIYMGNSGSHFLGFVLAAIALMVSYAPLDRKIALLSPILILGFPIFDTTFLILARSKQGISIFKKSDDHIALRFLSAGFPKRKALLYMFLSGAFFSLTGVALSQVRNLYSIILLSVALIASIALTIFINQLPRYAKK